MWRSKQWFVVINPTSGYGSSKRLWPKIKAYLDSREFNYNFQFTKYRKHSIDIVYNAIYQGFRDIIIVGGDGTIHNVVNAINTQSFCASNEINIGVIAIGTGNDW